MGVIKLGSTHSNVGKLVPIKMELKDCLDKIKVCFPQHVPLLIMVSGRPGPDGGLKFMVIIVSKQFLSGCKGVVIYTMFY